MVRSQYLCQLELESNGFIPIMCFRIAMFYIGLRLFNSTLCAGPHYFSSIYIFSLYLSQKKKKKLSTADEDFFYCGIFNRSALANRCFCRD